LKKKKKEIRWRGLPNSDNNQNELEKLEQEIHQRQDRIQKKKEYLQELEMQRILYTNLIERNTQINTGNDEERIFLPFIVIHTKKDTSIECEMSEDRKEYFFDFSLPFTIYDDNEILKRIGLSQPYWKHSNNYDHSLNESKLNPILTPSQSLNQRTQNTDYALPPLLPPLSQNQLTQRSLSGPQNHLPQYHLQNYQTPYIPLDSLMNK